MPKSKATKKPSPKIKKYQHTLLQSFILNMKNPKSVFRKRFFQVALVIALLIAVLIGFQAFKDISLNNSLDEVKASIESQNVNVSDRVTECYDEVNQTFGGKAGRSCITSMSIRVNDIDPGEVQEISNIVFNSASESTDFELSGEPPVVKETVREKRYGINGFDLKHKLSGRICETGFRYASEDSNLWINFSCETTSWFTHAFGI